MTREEWLLLLVEKARPMFKEAGSPLPTVRVAISPPANKAQQRYLGLCWHSSSTEDGGREIWISSTQIDPVELASTLVHELCHAALADGVKHSKPFVQLGKQMLLEGRAKYMSGGEAFKERWSVILESLPPYPGARYKAVAVNREKTNGGGKFKNVNCPECGFHAKVMVSQMDWGRLRCPLDNEMLLTKEEVGE